MGVSLSPELAAKILEPQLRIFLSVDIVGSTEIKHRVDPSKVQSWLHTFTYFLTDFPDTLHYCFNAKQTRARPAPLTLWKRLGDELIFTAPLCNGKDAKFYIEVFREAVNRFTAIEHPGKKPFKLKATAWVAGFPVHNAIIPTIYGCNGSSEEAVEHIAKGQCDYIGPAIDIGFRLAKHATKRMLVLSVELAWIFANISADFEIYYSGTVSLKGVNIQEYPLFWIPLESSEGYIDTELIKDVDARLLRKYCKSFFGNNESFSMPFIIGDEHIGEYDEDGYNKQLDKVKIIHAEVWGQRAYEPADAPIGGGRPDDDRELIQMIESEYKGKIPKKVVRKTRN